MQNLSFKYIRAKNFKCFGPEGVEFDLTSMNNVVLIRGNNLDIADDAEAKVSSNGVGKSSIPEILVYALFGKSITEKLNHQNMINNQIGKGLEVEVVWDKYRVLRTRKPDNLRLWENESGVWDKDHEITRGGMPATQQAIIEKLGLNFESFVNVVVFADSNSASFLECSTPVKREIVENLLSLGRYRSYSEKAKEKRKEIKDNISLLAKDYEHLSREVITCKDRIEKIKKQETDWKQQRRQELLTLIAKIKAKKEELEKTDTGGDVILAYNEAQERIGEINKLIPESEGKIDKIQTMVSDASDREYTAREQKQKLSLELHKAENKMNSIAQEIEKVQQEIDSLQGKEGTTCPVCYGEVSRENFQHVVDHSEKSLAQLDESHEKEHMNVERLREEIKKAEASLVKLRTGVTFANEKQTELNGQLKKLRNEHAELSKISKPDASADQRLIQQQIDEWKSQAESKKVEYEGDSPYVEILKITNQEYEKATESSEAKKKELEDAEAEMPYYEFWVKAFGDNGIRKFVIEGIIPALNSKIAHWINFLNINLSVKFNDQLEETITRNPPDGDPFVYYGTSGGQRRRINLAISQAFAHVMMLNSGRSPSVVFLDEVTTNIDEIGVEGVYTMIMELAKEKQVFVTTHDKGLLEMLDSCQKLDLEMKEGITRLV